MGIPREEQETLVIVSAVGDLVRIDSSIPKHIRALRKDPRFLEVDSFGGAVASFEIPVDRWSPVSGAKRVVSLSGDQRSAVVARLHGAGGVE